MGTNRIKPSQTKSDPETNQPETQAKKVSAKPKKSRSKRYTHVRSLVDRTITYPLDQAIDLVKRISRTKAGNTLTADINYRQSGYSTEISFPHSTGQTVKVAIVDEKLLSQIEAGNIDFDVLLSEPKFMPKLAKHAKLLGPRGLMPNPKNGTITDNPAKRQKELEAGKIAIKSERKAPLLHVIIGQTDFPSEHLVANITHLVKTLNPTLISKLTLSSTMSPGVKVDLNSINLE